MKKNTPIGLIVLIIALSTVLFFMQSNTSPSFDEDEEQQAALAQPKDKALTPEEISLQVKEKLNKEKIQSSQMETQKPQEIKAPTKPSRIEDRWWDN